MTTYESTNTWFNVKNDELTMKHDGKVYVVKTQYTDKDSFVMINEDKEAIWFNKTISGKAYRTYINDIIHVVSIEALNKVKSKELKGTTLQTITE